MLAVVVYHFDPLPTAWQHAVQETGFLGVDVFFVLSGFLITTLLLREPPRPLGRALAAFYMRRTLRILPLFYLGCGLYAAAAWLAGGHAWSVYRGYLPALLLYWADVHLGQQPVPFPYFGHAWSLAVEEKFYLLWPFAVLAWRRRAGRAIAVATIAGVLGWRTVVAWDEPASMALMGRLCYSFDLRIDSLMWGCLLAYTLHERAGYERLARWLRRGFAPALSLTIAAALATLTVLAANDGLRLGVRYALMPACLAVLLAVAVTAPHARALAWLRWRPIAWLGKVSYGIYVLHPLALLAARQVWRGVLGEPSPASWLPRFALYLAATLLASGASFRWFEAPLLRWKEHFR